VSGNKPIDGYTYDYVFGILSGRCNAGLKALTATAG
jgi:hypothetical protein